MSERTPLHVAVTGATGLIGTALCARLTSDGHTVRRIVRGTPTGGDAGWDPAAGRLDRTALDGVDAVVHLAGAGIGDKRWTDEYKRELVDSRLRSTELLATAIAGTERRPTVLLSGSAIGYYGDAGDGVLDESSPAGDGFLARLCVDWEAATAPVAAVGTRVVHLRTGIVLSATGGALKKQLPLFRLGLGGRFGSGRQWQSWISIDDEVGAICHLLTSAVSGPVNLTAPAPVTNAEFTQTLARVLRRPALLPIPAFGPRLLLGKELADALLYTGAKVVPTALERDGFTFRHPALEPALRALLGR